MELVTGYAGEPHVQADDLRELYAGIIGDGTWILPVGNRCKLKMNTANEFTVSDGSIIIQGAHVRIRPGQTEKINIENGSVGEKRNDLIVVRYEKDTGTGIETVKFAVKKGTSATIPEDPDVASGDIRTGDLIHEEPIYRVCLDGINVEKTECLVDVAPGICGIFNRIYPVGAIYMSVNATNPKYLFGGNWEVWGSGRVPVGFSQSEEEFNAAEKTGGSKYNNLKHKHAGTLGYDGNSYYTMNKFGSIVYPTNMSGEGYAFNTKASAKVSNVRVSYTSEALTSDVTNMQPYITCYMWKRVS